MCLFPRVYYRSFINKMQVKHYNHSSKGSIVEIHLHLPNIHQAKP
jgi:hypothetical protein